MIIKECYPEPFTLVHFSAASGIVNSVKKAASSKPVGGATSSHRANPSIKLGHGYIFITKKWGMPPQEKVEPLPMDELRKLGRRRKKK